MTVQYGTLTGTVTDSAFGAGIDGVQVSVAGQVGVTNLTGAYTISDILPGTYGLGAYKADYFIYYGTVTIVALRTTTCNFSMTWGLIDEQQFTFGVANALGITAELISLTKVKVNFSNLLKSGGVGSPVVNASAWEMRPVPGGFVHSSNNASAVKQVVAQNAMYPAWCVLNVNKMVPYQRYEIGYNSTKLVDVYGMSLFGNVACIDARETCVDKLNKSMSNRYVTDGFTNIDWITSSLGKELEWFMGDYQTYLPKGLR